MFILKKGHQPGVYVPLRALFLVVLYSPWGGCGGSWFLLYTPTIAQDCLLSRADINKLVSLNIIKPIMS